VTEKFVSIKCPSCGCVEIEFKKHVATYYGRMVGLTYDKDSGYYDRAEKYGSVIEAFVEPISYICYKCKTPVGTWRDDADDLYANLKMKGWISE
jgi:hypothetical protein